MITIMLLVLSFIHFDLCLKDIFEARKIIYEQGTGHFRKTGKGTQSEAITDQELAHYYPGYK